MTDLDDPSAWATAFGLAEAPLFGAREREHPEKHRVLLDGGNGTFMLSVSDLPDEREAASWAWSSDVTHHVGVGPEQVTVLRWDQPGAGRRFRRASVEGQIEAFYDYLLNDRLERGRSVVRHMMDLFRSSRAAVADASMPDEQSLGVFLAVLDDLARGPGTEPDWLVHRRRADGAAQQAYSALRDGRLGVEVDRFRRAQVGARPLDLHAALSIRHAGGLLFQEAHFELLSPSDLDLLGNARGGSLGRSRLGTHFTPPAIARSVVEQALESVAGLRDRQDLVVMDPACGSGAFLHEALRALQRTGFTGSIRVVGRDISPPAIDMARFVLHRALDDWPGHRASLDVEVGDSLAAPLPPADVVVMNPPFVAFAALDRRQVEQVRAILGPIYKGRPDLSMAFVSHALAALRPRGALGCLFPSSLLSIESADGWRRNLLERSGLRFLASIGDFGLFEYALVQVAAAVFADGPSDAEAVTLWTANDPGATGAALRELRKTRGRSASAGRDEKWHLGTVRLSSLAERPEWRLHAPRVGRLLRELHEGVGTTVADLFSVHQGIRTGLNEAFLLTADAWRALPEGERQYFRPAITNSSIRGGRLTPGEYVFYPYSVNGHIFASETDLASAVPAYYERFLIPNRARLLARSTVARRGAHWWSLAERRKFETGGKPRVVSKYFGSVGGFAVDPGSEAAMVQGYSWYPRPGLTRAAEAASREASDSVSPGLVGAYAALFNTRLFSRILEAYSAPVDGGQYDLSNRYVNAIRLPDLGALLEDSRARRAVFALEGLGRDMDTSDPSWADEAEAAAAAAYGLDLTDFGRP